jgi:hypothetical protein
MDKTSATACQLVSNLLSIYGSFLLWIVSAAAMEERRSCLQNQEMDRSCRLVYSERVPRISEHDQRPVEMYQKGRAMLYSTRRIRPSVHPCFSMLQRRGGEFRATTISTATGLIRGFHTTVNTLHQISRRSASRQGLVVLI